MFEVVPYRYWKNKVTGAKASLFGAVPYTSDASKAEWEVVEEGFTVYNKVRNTYGAYSLQPGATLDQAQAVADRLNTLYNGNR